MQEAIVKEGLANKMPGVDEVCAYLQDQKFQWQSPRHPI